jgi:hypothetical protein
VVSVTQRKESDLKKRFDDTSIDWAVIENQLVTWGELYRAGKKLGLNLSFNYVDASQSSTTSLGRTDKRGSSSTTRKMLAEGAAQLDAEQASTRHPSIWREVYNLKNRELSSIPHIIGQEGRVSTDEDGLQARWTKFRGKPT